VAERLPEVVGLEAERLRDGLNVGSAKRPVKATRVRDGKGFNFPVALVRAGL
jgi:hypothetical protein